MHDSNRVDDGMVRMEQTEEVGDGMEQTKGSMDCVELTESTDVHGLVNEKTKRASCDGGGKDTQSLESK